MYAYFASRKEEQEFEHQFRGQSIEVVAEAIEFIPGVGGNVPEISSWRLIEAPPETC